MLVKEYETLRNTSLCSVHPPFTFIPLYPSYSPQHFVPEWTYSSCVLDMGWDNKFQTLRTLDNVKVFGIIVSTGWGQCWIFLSASGSGSAPCQSGVWECCRFDVVFRYYRLVLNFVPEFGAKFSRLPVTVVPYRQGKLQKERSRYGKASTAACLYRWFCCHVCICNSWMRTYILCYN
jgi:hypothetical protein